MRFYINRAVVDGPWGGGNLWVKAAYQHLKSSDHHVFRPDDFKARPDIIWLAGMKSDGVGISAEQAIAFRLYFGNVKLIGRINENDARKGTRDVDKNLIKLSEHLDGTVFVSEWLKSYFMDKDWKCPNNTVIHNGVDGTIFKPNDKFDNGKVNIVTHHWSNNQLKGFDVYELLDNFVGKNDGFTFTYIGRENGTFKNTKLVRPLFGAELGTELGRYDVYVSASRHDPGPNHVLEALSCKIPTYVHVEGGGGTNFVDANHTYNGWDELKTILETKRFEPNSPHLLDWTSCIEKYVQFSLSL